MIRCCNLVKRRESALRQDDLQHRVRVKEEWQGDPLIRNRMVSDFFFPQPGR
jgi:hypothetical protein